MAYKIFAINYNLYLDPSFETKEEAEGFKNEYIKQILEVEFKDTFVIEENHEQHLYQIWDEETDEIHNEFFADFNEAQEYRDSLADEAKDNMKANLIATYVVTTMEK